MKSELPDRLDWVVRLRGVAALYVLCYHLWKIWGGDEFKFGMPGDFSFGLRSLFRAGYQGVDLFFVLSGFVIAWPYVLQRKTRLTRLETLDFYQRRYLRIAPIFYVSIAFAVILASFGVLKASTDPSIVLTHLLFAENFFPAMVAAIRGVYWTLPTEIHYYVLFPLLLRWVPLRRPLMFGLWAIAFAIGYRAFTIWSGPALGIWLTWTGGYLPARIEQFGLGLVAACAVVNAQSVGGTVSRRAMLGLTCIAVLVAVMIGRAAGKTLDWTYVVGPTLLAIAIAAMLYGMGVYFGAPKDSSLPQSNIPGSRLLFGIGTASLSLYLWHTFFLDVASNAAATLGLSLGARNLLIFIAGVASIPFSFLTYRLIERPFVTLSKSPEWRRKVARLVPPGPVGSGKTHG